ncbi:hypothetical protein JJD66_06420 [Pseudomonas sp. MF6751]|uniref:Imm40 family immunity protein n=1 Tax=Pseudomonas sp. MF6751 TaxID=2797528 RepID=UPI00190B4135|nr:Imm40 family immunity protein [Pseudomonas sp. MF6751]MBK3475711.1 hypothetical protein [Pseudomonas sp. MF6751]
MNFIWSERIDAILNCGLLLESMGVQNWALRRDDALRVINELEALDVPILGGDVYQLGDGTVEHTYDNWYCDQEPDEPGSVFLRRSLVRARNYICSYPNSDSLFAIVPGI